MSASTNNRRVRQAVMLAGGHGRRMMPLTLSTPKPMLRIHGRPFAAYLASALGEQGIERMTVLGGWLAEQIVEYFQDGSRFGLTVDYSISSASTLTARRLQLAASMLDDEFLLLYGDNYWPMNLARMEQQWRGSGLPAQMTVYDNSDGYSRANTAWNALGSVTAYDPTRRSEGLAGVDIGYMLMRRQLIELIPPVNQGLDTAFYPELVRRGWLGAHVTRHRYYGPSKPTRLADTGQFFSNPPFVLLDRDGVLNRKQGRGEYVRSWAQWEWLPGALDGLRTFASNGWRVLIVTNQAGVARGALTSESLDEIHARMKTEAAAAGGRVDGIYVCPHGWDEGCSCRKPSPGMLFAAQRDWTLDLSRTWFCGDDDRDREAAEAAGCRFAAVTEDQPLGLVAQRLCGLDSDIQMTRDLIHLAEALPSTGPAMPAADEKEPAWLNASF